MSVVQIDNQVPVKESAKLILSLQNIRILRAQADSQFELSIPEFQVEAGQFIAVTGQSGCGKSTLLDLLALVLKPLDEGSFIFYPAARNASFNSASSDSKPSNDQFNINELWKNSAENKLAQIRRKNLGYVPQSGGLLPFLSVRDNLFLPPRLNYQQSFKDRIQKQGEALGIAGLFDRKPQSLSGGQRQRVAILRAMAHQPELILADEPTAAVDSARAADIVHSFQALALQHNTAIIMVTHDQSLVKEGCNKHYSFDVDSTHEEHIRSICRRIA